MSYSSQFYPPRSQGCVTGFIQLRLPTSKAGHLSHLIQTPGANPAHTSLSTLIPKFHFGHSSYSTPTTGQAIRLRTLTLTPDCDSQLGFPSHNLFEYDTNIGLRGSAFSTQNSDSDFRILLRCSSFFQLWHLTLTPVLRFYLSTTPWVWLKN